MTAAEGMSYDPAQLPADLKEPAMEAGQPAGQMFEVPGTRLRELSDTAAIAIDMAQEATGRYLGLLKQTLTGMIYQDPPIPTSWLGYEGYREKERAAGFDFPQHAPCMIGLDRLANVQACVERVLADRVPGDLAEAGVWRGGTTIFLRALLKVAGVTDRDVWVIDSFAGLPPEAADGAGWAVDSRDPLAVPLEEVKANFALYGMLDEQVRFLPGWFADTLPTAPIGQLAVLRFDGDLYESARDVLDHLYPKLSPGGFVIIDDSHFAGVAKAVTEYRTEHDITAPYIAAGPWCAYWRKP